MRRIVLLIAFALIAAACGSGESATSSADTVASTTSSSSVDPTTTTDRTSDQEPSTTSTSEAGPAPDQPLPDSEYPAVIVADLAGGDFNLRELVLEDEPVLLWFWAPH